MSSRILEDEFEIGGDYKITAQFTNYREYKKARDFICELNREEEKPTPPKCVSAQTEPPRKPQGMLLLAKSNDTMLDVARNVIMAVETTIKVPTGLRSLTVNKDEETKKKYKN